MKTDTRISRLLDPNQFIDKCFWCGAYLPNDIKFQELHMKKVHKLVL